MLAMTQIGDPSLAMERQCCSGCPSGDMFILRGGGVRSTLQIPSQIIVCFLVLELGRVLYLISWRSLILATNPINSPLFFVGPPGPKKSVKADEAIIIKSHSTHSETVSLSSIKKAKRRL